MLMVSFGMTKYVIDVKAVDEKSGKISETFSECLKVTPDDKIIKFLIAHSAVEKCQSATLFHILKIILYSHEHLDTCQYVEMFLDRIIDIEDVKYNN